MIKIAPSILSANFANLGNEVRALEQAGADWIHVDVMDGHFVPNITIGPPVIEAIRPYTSIPLDVHLMIESPEQYVEQFVQAGADIVSVHAEACTHLHRTIYQIKEAGAKAGVVLNPASSLHRIEEILSDVDLVLFMTVNPGFGGQSLIPSVLTKVRKCRRWLQQSGLKHIDIEVDGGVNEQTAAWCKKAGANVLVAGSAVFQGESLQASIEALRQSSGSSNFSLHT